MTSYKIHQGNALDVLRSMPDESVQCCKDLGRKGLGGKIRTSREGVTSTRSALTLSTLLEVNMAKEQPTLFPTSVQKHDGRFQKGERRSPATEFKKGQHAYRQPRPHWKREWMIAEYVLKGRSTGEIAAEIGTTDGNVLYWLRKHGIPRRDVSEARSLKHWGAKGEDNPMFGRRGPASPSWKGGVTAERQDFYSSREWKDACRRVWLRDKAQCQRCSVSSRIKKLHVHHITSFAVKQLRATISNLVLLCIGCHRWVHSKANTDNLFINRQWKS